MPNTDEHNDMRLLRDADIAELANFTPGWVRKQRMLRRRGQAHCLDIDPVEIGRCPRYRVSDVKAWLGRITARPGAGG